jgi:hypothetical protein
MPVANYNLLATDAGYRVHCSHLPAGGHVTALFAVATVDMKRHQATGWHEFALLFNTNDTANPDFSPYQTVYGYPVAQIFSPARPTMAPEVIIDGNFIVGQRSYLVRKKRIPAQEP